MHLNGQHTIWADPSAVWTALHDVDVLKPCLPGCRTLQRTSVGRFEVAAEVSIGPVCIPLEGCVEIIRSEEPRALRLHGRGAGTAAFGMSGIDQIELTSCAVGCRVTYDIEVAPIGLLATIGRPFLDARARYQIEEFARAFKARVGTPPATVAPLDVDRPQALS